MKLSVEKIKQVIANKPVLQRFDGEAWHNNYANIGAYTKALEKYTLDFESYVLKIVEEQQQKLIEFQSWLEEREQGTKADFDKKGWGDTKLEITVVKEKFAEFGLSPKKEKQSL